MKKYLKSTLGQGQNNVTGVLLMLVSLVLASCTKNFEKYNTNSTALSPAQSAAIASSAIGPLEQAIYSNYQVAQNLSADAYSGYSMSAVNFQGGNNNLNYFMVSTWNQDGFDDQYKLVMSPVSKIAQAGTRTISPDIWAVALLVQVEAMDRVTDRFGPIPYTKAGSSLTSIPYDSQQTIYQTFFNQIDTAVSNLHTYIAANPGKKPIGTNDLIYGGDYTEWLKFANSLRLRLAMRIVKIDPATAKLQATKALSDAGGLLTTPADDANIAQSGSRSNDLWVVTIDYAANNQLSASLGSYLTGYNDPRTSVYAVPATAPAQIAGKYVGIRLGAANVTANNYSGFATYNCVNTFTQFAPQLIMTAAEVWFLRAEAALRGWSTESVQTDYETGITTSMQQWGVSAGNYLSDATSTEAAYVDPLNAGNNSAGLSTITIKWDNSATPEQMLERIITQKWLAIFPDGQEAWADFRRTGYPKLFTTVTNLSQGTIDTQIQIRRLPYANDELTTNGAAAAAGIKLLGGPNTGGTRLWWDVNAPNF